MSQGEQERDGGERGSGVRTEAERDTETERDRESDTQRDRDRGRKPPLVLCGVALG